MLLEESSRDRSTMALDLERPVDSRSSSPEDRSSSHMGRQGGMAPQVPSHSLKFSIEKILSPDFGRRESIEKEQHSNNISKEHQPSKELPISSKSSSVSNENAAPGGSSGPDKGGIWPQATIPAWLFCTRFSDRPSSGKPPYKLKFVCF